jgi:cyclic di-GMP phosphodiesterase
MNEHTPQLTHRNAEAVPPTRVHALADARNPLLRLARGLAAGDGSKPALVARELASLTGAGYTAVYLLDDDVLSPEAAAGTSTAAAVAAAAALARAALEAPIEQGGRVAVPLVAGEATLGAIVALPAGSPLIIDLDLVCAVADLAASALVLDSRAAASHAEARRDPVSGLGNRRAFDERLADAVAASAGRPSALLIVDLDDFKSVNDRRGHASGDAVLREVARVLTRSVRPTDGVFRLGGDEFAVVVDGGRAAAARIGQRIRRGLRAHRRAQLPTASGGVATTQLRGDTPDELARRADAALYAAKKAGKDRVFVHQPGGALDAVVPFEAADPGPPLRALIVDDDPALRELVRTVLEGAGVEVFEATTGRETRRRTDATRFDVVVLDLGLPDEDGLALCHALKQARPELPIVVLTGRDAVATEGSAVVAGADAFLHKPFGPLELIDVVERLAGRAPAGQTGARGGSRRKGGQAQLLAHDFRSLLEIERGQRLLLQRAYRQTVTALAAALETKDTSTEKHSKRVQRYAFLLAAAVDPLLVDDPSVEYGFLLHDVGKIGIPDRILLKPGPLTPSERRLMETHTLLGEQLLADVEILQGAGLQIVRSHHERWDGGGYPDGTAAREIPLGARIFAVADTLDAMTTERPYRSTASWHDAIAEIERHAGTQFDPSVVDAFATCEPSLREIHASFAA